MKKIEDLLTYEMPTIAEFVPWGWLQTIIAKYLAWKVTRKVRRYEVRLKRAEFFKNLN